MKPFGALDAVNPEDLEKKQDDEIENNSCSEGEEEDCDDDEDCEEDDDEDGESDDDGEEDMEEDDEIEEAEEEEEDDGVEADTEEEESDDDDESEEDANPDGMVRLKDIAMVYGKKSRQSREERLASVMRGREGRPKFGQRKGKMNPHSSTTHRQKRKMKPFLMVQNKSRRTKAKKSFREKQMAFRNALQKRRNKVR